MPRVDEALTILRARAAIVAEPNQPWQERRMRFLVNFRCSAAWRPLFG